MIGKLSKWIILPALTAFVVASFYKGNDSNMPQAGKEMGSAKALAAPVAKNTTEDRLRKARESFAAGDIEGSIMAYKEYIRRNASDADARGELGDAYYRNGNLQESAQAYYDAAKLLIARKQLERVPALLPVIARVNPALAEELAQKINPAPRLQTTSQIQPGQQLRQAPQSATRFY